MGSKFKVAIIGSGNIGTDLLVKVSRSPFLECTLFIGRNLASPGMSKALSMGVKISDHSIDAIIEKPEACQLVFDATSAKAHLYHAPILKKMGKLAIDLTPAKVGALCSPAVNLHDCIQNDNVNMITCGGQASTPIAYAIGKAHEEVEYIEVVSSIASRSAGPATRANLDEYIDTTETAIKRFSGSHRAKAILNLNPAYPCINMQTTIFAKVKNPNLERLKIEVANIVKKVQLYVPGYELIVGPILENKRIVVMVRVHGLGDYLPSYAGNLDIINCAAVAMAEEYAKAYSSKVGE